MIKPTDRIRIGKNAIAANISSLDTQALPLLGNKIRGIDIAHSIDNPSAMYRKDFISSKLTQP